MIDELAKLLTARAFGNPLFVVGLGRSGTTVLLQALGKHPHILSVKSESPLIYHIGGMVYEYELSDYGDWHQRSLRFPIEHLRASLRKLIFESVYGKHYGLFEVLRRIYRADFSILNKRMWAARTYPQYEEALGILHLFPSARFVYIYRNGCDVVQSRTRYRSFRELPFTEHCETWARHIYKYLYFLNLKQAITISHEEFTLKPEFAFTRIFQLTGVKQHPGPAGYVKSTMVHPLDQSTKKGIEVGQAFKQRPPAYLKWSPEQKETFKSVCGDAMNKMGYEIPF